MKERPILFSGAMIRAILSGAKSQTRRAMKPQPELAIMDAGSASALRDAQSAGLVPESWQPRWRWRGTFSMPWPSCVRHDCPYGQVGDRLWVRETIRLKDRWNGGGEDFCVSAYVADGAPTKADGWPWKRDVLPAIHCPRGLSRITLEVTGVRVERLQDITEDGVKAEGFASLDGQRGVKAAFATMWDEINGKRAPWSSSPWVWVVSFKRVTP